MKKILLFSGLLILFCISSNAQIITAYTSVSANLGSYNSCSSTSTNLSGNAQLNIPVEIGTQSCSNTNFTISLQRSTGGAYTTLATTSVTNSYLAPFNFTITRAPMGSGTYRVMVTATGCGYIKTGYSSTFNVTFSLPAVSNFKLFVGATNYSVSATTPTAVSGWDINSLRMTSLSTGTITNAFVEVMEVNSVGAYVGGYYNSQWYSYQPVNALVSSMAYPGLWFVCGKYYKIKLAVTGPCTTWSEKSAFIHVTGGGCKTDDSGTSPNSVFEQSNTSEIHPITLFPNPTQSTFSINGNQENEHSVVLTDMTGKLLFRSSGTISQINLELSRLSNLNSGTYIVRITDNVSKQHKTEKLVRN